MIPISAVRGGFLVILAELVSIMGPNGSGKSTTLRLITRLLKPTQGAVYLVGGTINRLWFTKNL
ncbi:ATP-binding cassette domain-containing protein [Bacillus salitolerans]|uniref:ATP-binding cassette domain-containing protein n=1 Tax=Bacillus salitolerans TaxID=1437434 RepID=A0ABW4LSW2_9BACI